MDLVAGLAAAGARGRWRVGSRKRHGSAEHDLRRRVPRRRLGAVARRRRLDPRSPASPPGSWRARGSTPGCCRSPPSTCCCSSRAGPATSRTWRLEWGVMGLAWTLAAVLVFARLAATVGRAGAPPPPRGGVLRPRLRPRRLGRVRPLRDPPSRAARAVGRGDAPARVVGRLPGRRRAATGGAREEPAPRPARRARLVAGRPRRRLCGSPARPSTRSRTSATTRACPSPSRSRGSSSWRIEDVFTPDGEPARLSRAAARCTCRHRWDSGGGRPACRRVWA